MTVTIDQCDTRHRSLWRVLGILCPLFALFLVLVGWALYAVASISQHVEANRSDIRANLIKQEGTLESIRVELRNIKDQQVSMQKMVFDLWEHNHRTMSPPSS